MNESSRSIVEVGISMVLKDRFTQEAGKISQSFRTMMADMRMASQGYQGAFGDVSEIGMNLVNSMYDAYKYAAGVQNEIWLTSKIAGANAKEAAELMKTAQRVNAETPLTAAQVASAERYLAMAGNSADKIQDLIGPAAQLASIFGMNPGGKGGVADILTNIMAMFQMDTSKTTNVADDIYTAVTNANMSLEDLMATVRYSGADMAAAGVSFRELAAAAGALGDVGIQGTMAGTSLGNMIRYLQLTLAGQKRNGIDTLKGLGLSVNDFYDENGKFLGIGNALQKFLGVYKQMNSIQRTQDFYNMLGVRGMRGMIPILEAMAKGNDKFTKIMERYDENAGIVEQVNKERLSTNAGILDMWESSLENLKVTFGQAAGGPFNSLLQIGTSVVDWLNNAMQNEFGAKTIERGVGLIITGTVWVTLKGILAFVRSIGAYTRMVTTSVAATAKNTLTSTQLLQVGLKGIEGHLIAINQTLYKISLQQRGLTLNTAGQVVDMKSRRFAKDNTGRTTMGTIIAGSFDKMEAANQQNAPAGATVVNQQKKLPWWKRMFSGNALIGALGKVAGVALRLLNPIMMVVTALQLLPFLVDGIKWLGDALNINTESNREKQLKEIRKQNEEIWYNAIKQGVVDGMRNSNINVSVDGSPAGTFTPGTQQDYTGGILLGL